jgi:hypothetical protein
MVPGLMLEILTLRVLKRWDEWSGTRGYTVLDTDCRLLYSIVWNEEMRSDERDGLGVLIPALIMTDARTGTDTV